MEVKRRERRKGGGEGKRGEGGRRGKEEKGGGRWEERERGERCGGGGGKRKKEGGERRGGGRRGKEEKGGGWGRERQEALSPLLSPPSPSFPLSLSSPPSLSLPITYLTLQNQGSFIPSPPPPPPTPYEVPLFPLTRTPPPPPPPPQAHLSMIREVLAASFKDIPLPGSKETPTASTIDTYMSKLQTAISSEPNKYPVLVEKVSSITKHLEKVLKEKMSKDAAKGTVLDEGEEGEEGEGKEEKASGNEEPMAT